MENLWQFARKYIYSQWKWYVTGLIALAVTNLVALKIPQLAKEVVNQVGVGEGLGPIENLALWIIGFGFLQIIFRFLSRILVFWPGRNMEAQVKNDLFGKILYTPQSLFDRFGVGDLVSRLSNDVSHLRVYFGFGGLMILNFICLGLFILSHMVMLNWVLALLCLLPLFTMLVIARLILPWMHRFSLENQMAFGELTNKVTEAFVNVHVIQANAANQAFIDRIEQANRGVYDTNKNLLLVQTFLFPLITGLSGLSQVIVLLYGGYEVLSGRLTLGDILLFNVYIGYLAFPLSAIGMVIALNQRAKTALKRLEEIQSAEAEGNQPVVDPQSPISSLDFILDVRDLSFSFDADDLALRDVSFSVKKGEKIGIFGPIGSGKSVLFSLITRLYSPPEGTVFYKGRDVLSINPGELRGRIGYVLQNPHLFSDSVRNNLVFGLESAGEKSVPESSLKEAVRGSGILSEILSFESGWETAIGERGIRLSGGQKQRLALARVFLRNMDLLLLDDVFSSVDQKTEREILEFLKTLNLTMVISSHRSSVFEFCDRVIFLKHGEVLDQGSYSELLARCSELSFERDRGRNAQRV